MNSYRDVQAFVEDEDDNASDSGTAGDIILSGENLLLALEKRSGRILSHLSSGFQGPWDKQLI